MYLPLLRVVRNINITYPCSELLFLKSSMRYCGKSRKVIVLQFVRVHVDNLPSLVFLRNVTECLGLFHFIWRATKPQASGVGEGCARHNGSHTQNTVYCMTHWNHLLIFTFFIFLPPFSAVSRLHIKEKLVESLETRATDSPHLHSVSWIRWEGTFLNFTCEV